MAEENTHPRHLTPSELGTKEYWESFYENSLAHISSKKSGRKQPHVDGTETNNEDNDNEDDDDDDDDPGTSWFTEHNAPEKVLRYLTSDSFPLAPCNTTTTTTTTGENKNQRMPTILDIGTGNGSMLSLLRDEGEFPGSSMVGIDYSLKSIELARQLVNKDQGQDQDGEGIRFEVCDVLGGEFEERRRRGGGGRGVDWFPGEGEGEGEGGGFDIVLDKGTFDAISLAGEEGEGEGERKTGSERICERYPGVVKGLIRRGGFFVVTSCNWTESELIDWFKAGKGGDGGDDGFVVWDRIEYPKFRFGGQEGQGVCTVCFRRKGGDLLET